MNPCDSTHPATAPYYREARVTFARRQTACGMRHCFARRIEECHGRRKLSCTPTRWAERQRIIEAEASRIAEPMAVSVSNTATQAVAFRKQKAPSSPRLPIKSLSLGGQRGIFSFRGKRISPLTAPPARPQEKCKNLSLRFQRPASSKDPRQDRAQRSNQEADDADDHIERNFLLKVKKREDRRQDGL